VSAAETAISDTMLPVAGPRLESRIGVSAPRLRMMRVYRCPLVRSVEPEVDGYSNLFAATPVENTST
jgi:hypothetical protein